jgi:hypothetical protein
VELDEEATAESIAQFGFVRPVMRAVPERWFDVALVVDRSRSMDPWLRTVEEFEQLLARHGAFGIVRQWGLHSEGKIALEPTGGARTTTSALADPRARTLILVVTNGVGAYWNSDEMACVLRDWSQRAPVAIVQLFSERQWPHTALGPGTRLTRAPQPGAVNAMLDIERKRWERRLPVGSFIAVPILSLAPQPIARWADATMSVGLQGAPAVVFAPVGKEEPNEDPEPEAQQPRASVNRFRAFASPEAFRLACYLAAVPLTLPIMRIVQQEVARAPLVEHLAEVVSSGLIDRVTPADATVDPDMVVYDFRPGVRDELLGELQLGTTLEVRATVEGQLKAFIELQLGRSVENFRAFVLDEAGRYELPESAQALVEIERGLLWRFGVRGIEGYRPKGARTLDKHIGIVRAVAFGPSGLLASCSDDRTIRMWDADGSEVWTFVGHEGPVTTIAFSTDGEHLASGSSDGTIRVWSCRSGQLLRTMEGRTLLVHALAFLGTDVLASGSETGLKLWNLTTGSQTFSLEETSPLYAIAASPDGSMLAGSNDEAMRVWDTTTFQALRSFEGHSGYARSVAFRPDGKALASGSTLELIVWDVATGGEIHRFPCRDCPATVAFSRDGHLVGSAVGGHAICLWDCDTGDEIHRLEGVRASSLAFSPDGVWLAAGTYDHVVYLWRLQDLEELVIPGQLNGVPTLPDLYWARWPDDDVLRSFAAYPVVELTGPPGSGRRTSAVAWARNSRVRQSFPGGIYWQPLTYPDCSDPVLLIDPQFEWQSHTKTRDRVITTRPATPTGTYSCNDLNPPQQHEFLGELALPDSLQVPALGRIKLLARWKRILRHFGVRSVEDWLSRKTVPAEYGDEALRFAARCATDLLGEADRSLLKRLTVFEGDVSLSPELVQRRIDVGIEDLERALSIAQSLDLVETGDGIRPLRLEARMALRAEDGHADTKDSPPTRIYQFFVGYSHSDKGVPEFAKRVNEELARLTSGATEFFLDQDQIRGGDRISESIENGLANSSVLLFVLSPKSVASEWARREMIFFLEHKRTIVPVIWTQCAVPVELAHLHVYSPPGWVLAKLKPNSHEYAQVVRDVAAAILRHAQREVRNKSDSARYLDPSWLAASASQGYRALMEELYNHRGDDAEVNELYWALLGTVRGSDEDWRDWFARILRQIPPPE